MPHLTYRRNSPDGYGISADGCEIGSVWRRDNHVQHRSYWHWGVDTMPFMSHGGRPPSGNAESFGAGPSAFKAAFITWQAAVPAELWMRNVDYIEACAARWR